MANEQILISGIEYKVRKLIEQFGGLKKENDELHQHIDALENKVKALSLELKKSETNY